MRVQAAGVLLLAFLIGISFLSTGEAQQSGGSASEKKSKAHSVYSEIGKAPEKARAKKNPLEKDPDAVAAGRILFEQRCAECHGADGEGSRRGPSLRAAQVQNAEPGTIFWVMTNGVVRKGMPVWSKLPEPQRWQIVSYIKSLGTTASRRQISPSAAEPPASKDSPLPHR